MPKKPYTNKRIGDILIEQGLITPQQLKEALEMQKNGNKKQSVDKILFKDLFGDLFKKK